MDRGGFGNNFGTIVGIIGLIYIIMELKDGAKQDSAWSKLSYLRQFILEIKFLIRKNDSFGVEYDV